jgi:Neuraminidase (sialidase)
MVPNFWVTDNVALDLHATVTDRATCGKDTVDSVGGAWTTDAISIASSTSTARAYQGANQVQRERERERKNRERKEKRGKREEREERKRASHLV